MIGIFDSGSGGLTVLNAVLRRLPEQRFLYLGDHANAPYGPRPPEEVRRLTRAGVETLFERGCTLVILACNTASAIALRPLQEDWLAARYPGRRLLGVFVPIIEALTGRVWDRDDSQADPRPAFDIAVFATPATVQSGAFGREIRRRLPNVTVREQGCPDLVDLIEKGADASSVDSAIGRAVAALQSTGSVPGRVILGCTHYPLVQGAFANALPAGTVIMDQPAIVADSLGRYLARRPGIVAPVRPAGARAGLLTTGDPNAVGPLATHLRRADHPAMVDGPHWQAA